MADNVEVTAGTGTTIAADEVTIDGAVAKVQRVKVSWGVAGAAVDASASNPFPTVQTGALPAGTNNIGDVDVLTLPALPAGTNNIGDVDVLTLPALPAGNNNIGDVDIASIAAGDNNIGNVDIVSLPALPAGSNSIGTVVPAGNVASGAADAGNPIKTGGVAVTAAPSAVDNGDRVDQAYTLRGAAHTSWRRNDGTEVDPDAPAQVIGTLATVAVTPTVESTPDYSTGDVIGGIMTFATILRADTKTAYAVSVRLTSKVAAASMAAVDVYFFNASPSGSTTTENGAFVLADADRAKLLGKIAVSTWDVVGSTISTAYAEGRVPITGAAADDIFVVMVARGTINLGSTSDLTAAVTVDQN
jgi:hypothetical protein